jgi:hypothetical protein
LWNDGADEVVVPTGGEVGCGRRENVAAVEGGGDGGLNHPVLIGDFAGGVEAVAVHDGSEDTVVWGDKVLSLFRFSDDGFAGGANAGIDDDEEDGVGGVIGGDAGEKAGSFFDGKRSDLMGDIGEANVGRDAPDNGAADGDGVVGGAEVGHEDDGGARGCGGRGVGGGRGLLGGGLRARRNQGDAKQGKRGEEASPQDKSPKKRDSQRVGGRRTSNESRIIYEV